MVVSSLSHREKAVTVQYTKSMGLNKGSENKTNLLMDIHLQEML